MNEDLTIKKDPWSFTITCTIGILQFAKGSFRPWSKYQLDALRNLQEMWIGKLKSSIMRFLIADKSIQNPVRILYDTLVKVDRLKCPTNFIILDCNVDVKIPIILGRPL